MQFVMEVFRSGKKHPVNESKPSIRISFGNAIKFSQSFCTFRLGSVLINFKNTVLIDHI
jgi:hypothetical protein